MLVYLAKTPSNQVYIGITKFSLERRKNRHFTSARNGSMVPFHKAIQEFGNEITWEVLEEVRTWKIACAREKRHIANFSKTHDILNATGGGQGALGRKHSEETKALISRKNTGKKRSEEFKRAVSQKWKGVKRKHTSESRRKLSEARYAYLQRLKEAQ